MKKEVDTTREPASLHPMTHLDPLLKAIKDRHREMELRCDTGLSQASLPNLQLGYLTSILNGLANDVRVGSVVKNTINSMINIIGELNDRDREYQEHLASIK